MKIGDKVVCVDVDTDINYDKYTQSLTLGKIYEVIDKGDNYTKVYGDQGDLMGYYPWRFKLARKLNKNIKIL